jgi:glycine dehydrogenase subunit 1
MNYVPNSANDRQSLLAAMSVPSIESLFKDIPKKVALKEKIPLPPPLSEPELLEELARTSADNNSSSFLGGGCYRHFIPSVVKHLASRSEFYTAYTPYQAEASQGILQAIYEYQTMLCELTGMDVANASMYDGATALVEAAFLACRATGRKEIIVSSAVHPAYREVLRTYAKGADLIVKEVPYTPEGLTGDVGRATGDGAACVILQQPNFFGNIEPTNQLASSIHSQGALFVVCVDPVSLGILAPPGKYGADLVVGEGQSLGNPSSFGGPGLGLFAAKKDFARQMPGRIAGQTVDAEGKRGFCLTLQTREQHIRRERATSNICSNEALAALAAAVYLSTLGKAGLRKVAELCLQKANYLKRKIRSLPSSSLLFPDAPSFKEFVVKTKKKVGLDLSSFYPELKGSRLICVTELARKEELDALAKIC